MEDPQVSKQMLIAIGILWCILKSLKDAQENFEFHEDVEFYIELENLGDPPQFKYYIVDHLDRSIFWGGGKEPESIHEAEGVMKETMLREEYWKHVEYYPCHRPVESQYFEELKELLAGYATDAATSEGSTSPMSASDIRTHLDILNSFGEGPSDRQTWVTARLFGLFMRAQLLNRYGTQEARLDRFDSLDNNPPSFQDHYAMINFYLILGLGQKHLNRCSRTWADRIAYTQSWREYKTCYLEEWKEIRNLAGMMLIACTHISRVQSFFGQMLQRVAAITSLLSLCLSYHLTNELKNTGQHAADAATYFQMYEEYKYGIQRLSLWNCLPQALLCWAGCLLLAVLVIETP